jgi:phage shock protein PspC (stress-responsive transcriptional regulator)
VALLSKSTASELKHMFHLPFEISRLLLIVCVITGGFLMIVIQYLLVKFTMKRTLQDN